MRRKERRFFHIYCVWWWAFGCWHEKRRCGASHDASPEGLFEALSFIRVKRRTMGRAKSDEIISAHLIIYDAPRWSETIRTLHNSLAFFLFFSLQQSFNPAHQRRAHMEQLTSSARFYTTLHFTWDSRREGKTCELTASLQQCGSSARRWSCKSART